MTRLKKCFMEHVLGLAKTIALGSNTRYLVVALSCHRSFKQAAD